MNSSFIPDRPLRVLHVEDDADDCFLIQTWFEKENLDVEIVPVNNERELVKAMEQSRFDVILSDIKMDGFDGLVALRIAQERDPSVPFIFVTGSIGEEAAVETMKKGATDYVLKDRLARLIPAIKRAVAEAVQEQKRRESEEKNRQQAALLDKAQDAIMVKDMDGRIQYWNKSAERIYGWTATQMMGGKASELLSENPDGYEAAQRQLLQTGEWKGELLKSTRGGNELIVESHWTLVHGESGRDCVFVIDTDVTEKKAMEARFLRSQRMDSIGALAGGIAHDLNNALAPVIMSVELLRDADNGDDRKKFLDIIQSNAMRATGLVKQILSFARGTRSPSKPVLVSRLIEEMEKMIRDTFRKSISIATQLPAKELWAVQGDSTELHQVLLNLCVNARDAMPEGGCLTLSADNFVLSANEALAFDAKPGRYVMVSVADTGSGIPPEVLPHIFEPFFTTKEEGKGTGLGLATVAGIIKRYGGFMDIDTAAGKGTTFKIYLPAIESADTGQTEQKERHLPAGRGELILLIDDEETLTQLNKAMLESFGYRVLTARDGLQAVARFKEHQEEVNLVITDSDMPHIDGRQVIHSIKVIKPNIPILIASGTKGEMEEVRRMEGAPVRNLEKPFSLEQLLKAVDAALHN